MTAAATWDPRYCEAVWPWSVTSPPRCRCQNWQVTPAAATQEGRAWTTHEHVRTHTWVWSSTHHGWSAAAALTEQLHWQSQLVRTAALRLDRSSPERVPGNLFPSREIYFPGINDPNVNMNYSIMAQWSSSRQLRWVPVVWRSWWQHTCPSAVSRDQRLLLLLPLGLEGPHPVASVHSVYTACTVCTQLESVNHSSLDQFWWKNVMLSIILLQHHHHLIGHSLYLLNEWIPHKNTSTCENTSNEQNSKAWELITAPKPSKVSS